MKRSIWSLVVAGTVLAAGGVMPGCTCNHNGAANGDGGNGNGDAGAGNGDGGLNACGDNDPSCTTVCMGPTCMPPGMFPLPGDQPPDPNVGADGVDRNPAGDIVLNQGKANSNYLWIADDQAYWVGMVSKIDTRASTAAGGAINNTYREVARYITVTCDSNEAGSWRDHSGLVLGVGAGSATPTQITDSSAGVAACDGTNGCCSRAPAGQRKPIQLYNNRPSRTAVDFNGDVWVANRAHDPLTNNPAPTHFQASVSKIANKNNSITDTDCIDRNKNGVIDTSFDANGDGIINTDCNGDGFPDDGKTVCSTGVAKEFWGLDDECILFTTDIGPDDATCGGLASTGCKGRPLALGQGSTDFAPSDAWAGLYENGTFYRVDGTSGYVKQTVQIKVNGNIARGVYGAVVDGTGILWAPSLGTHNLWYFDTNAPATNQGLVVAGGSSGTGFYGIAEDGYTGQYTPGGPQLIIQNIWVAKTGQPGVFRYTPDRRSGFASLGQGSWTEFTFGTNALGQAASGNGRGVGVDNRSPTSFAWVALDGSNGLGQVPVNANLPLPLPATPTTTPVSLTTWTATNGGITTLGAGVAVDLDVWGINQGNDKSSAVPTNATHFHVDAAGNVTAPTAADQVRLDDNGLTPGAVAHRGPYPYTYSDFTGFGLRNFTNPHGSYSYIWSGCPNGKTKWIGITWDADVPPGTGISVKARSADDKTALGQATYTGSYTTSPASLLAPAPAGGMSLMPNPAALLQVEFDLTTTVKNATPALKSYTVTYECLSSIG